jgi:hypothetical protein
LHGKIEKQTDRNITQIQSDNVKCHKNRLDSHRIKEIKIDTDNLLTDLSEVGVGGTPPSSCREEAYRGSGACNHQPYANMEKKNTENKLTLGYQQTS